MADKNDEPDNNEPRPLGQDEIDGMFRKMGDESADSALPPASSDSSLKRRALGQAEIDALVSETNDDSEETDLTKASNADPESKSYVEPKSSLGQSEIDALLAELNESTSVKKAPETAATNSTEEHPLNKAEMDNLIQEIEEKADEVGGSVDKAVNQEDIDNLLHEMGIYDQKLESNLLSTEQIVGIVKHQQETGEPVTDIEAMIDQDDINSLLNEMSKATGVPDQDGINDKISNNEHDIEALLEQASSPMATSDAVKGSLVFGQQSYGQAGMNYQNAAVMAPDELRGTKYLLVAAVGLLAMCAVTMGFVVSSINSLAIELEQNRMSELKPMDDFQENIMFAEKLLGSQDELEVIQGIKFVSQLKENYDKDSEKIVTLTLLMADHFRGKGAYSKAQKEYRAMTERRGVLYDQPQYYLDYADTLFLIGEQHYDEAVSIIYRLLANEHYYLDALAGEARAEAEVFENKRIIQEAYLMLGRIYTAQLELTGTRSGT